MNIGIPTEKDWFDWPANAMRYLDLDENYARGRFLGKSYEQALQLFLDVPVLGLAEDVGYMPPIPFQFYMQAYKSHVWSQGQGIRTILDDASDSASAFLILIESRLEFDAETIAPIMEDLIPTIEFIGLNQEKYDAPVHIYGDFRMKVTRIHELWDVYRKA